MPGFYMVSRDPNSGQLTWQVFYPLIHLPSPKVCAIYKASQLCSPAVHIPLLGFWVSPSYLLVVSNPNVSISHGLDYLSLALGPSVPTSRWVVLANATSSVRSLTMSSKAGQKCSPLHLGSSRSPRQGCQYQSCR